MFLQRVRSVWEIDWDGRHTYGDILLDSEVDHCRYGFELADVEGLRQAYDLFETEAQRCLEAGLVTPAHDYVLRCSHAFNLLDARGAVGVTERATFFRRMRDLSRQVAEAYVEQRARLDHPWLRGEVPTSAPRAPDSGRVESETAEPETLLLEVGTEELPAGDVSDAMAQLRQRVPALLEKVRLDHERLQVWGTPRRLVVLAEKIAPRQRAVEELVKGPPVRAAFDADGRPTKAAAGFARKNGVDVAALEVREIDGGEYVVALRRQEGRPAVEVLVEALPDLVAGLHFQTGMRWNASGVAFSRPVRWIVALLGETVIPFEYAGLSSGRTSRGARPAGSPGFEISRAGDYPGLLKAHHVLADPDGRRALIAAQVTELAAGVGGRVPDGLLESGNGLRGGRTLSLLEEVTNLVEQPTAFLGHFEEAYLSLPADVLVAVMKKHQRCFPVVDGEGRLLPHFIAVRNGGDEHLDVVRQGNEEVIRARFADADFFYREDTKRPLEAFLPRLDTLTFQEQLGSMLDKTRRLEGLVPELAGMLGLSDEEARTAARAAHLCKADLATEMVIEFTTLQGVMGREYALRAGEPADVAQVVFEHYLPRFAGDASPGSRPALVVGLADRLDSLAGLFAVGLAPTASADPYGLRRGALGLVQNQIAARLSFSVPEGLAAATRLLPVAVDAEVLEAAREFVVGRLRVYLREQGFRYDVVDAVLAARGDDPYRARVAVEQLGRWIEREEWPRILDNYARCVRITRDLAERFPLDPARFTEPAEHELYAAHQEARAGVSPQSSVDEFLTAFVPMVDVIDRFFAKESGVLVMAEDRAVRENRLALLQHVAALAEGIADLSRLEGF